MRTLGFLSVLLITSGAFAIAPTISEMKVQQQWVAEKLVGSDPGARDVPSLLIVENHDPVQKNARAGRPLRLGEQSFTHGLYCHARSNVRVQNLPAGAKVFRATVGVDSNEQTSGGRGSVVFIVEAAGKRLFKSDLMHEGTKPIAINVELNGATEISLIVTDGGDGIACDQSDWADAEVEFADGSKLPVGDLPMASSAPAVTKEPMFSFTVGGKAFSELVAGLKPERTSKQLDENRIQHEIVWHEPRSHLEIRCEAVEYADFPTVEWTVYLKNIGAGDSELIEHLQAIDTTLRRDPSGEFVLHHNVGALAGPIDYQPLVTKLGPKESIHIATAGGRSSNSDLPYFNVGWEGAGAIVVLGWPGQWAADFVRDEADGLRVVGGQELTHFKLHAGEEVRTPLVVMQFYQGDVTRAQNIWRRWMIAHNTPRQFGKPPAPQINACSSHQFHEMILANEENQKLFVDRYVEEKLGLNYWWMDAGWYVNSGDWPNTGTWEVDRERFPNGLRAITDEAHAKGVKSIVWFEPERVDPGTFLYEKHPEWLLGKEGGDKLLNLGNPEAAKWWTEHADGLIKSEGIDLFRSDYNIDPLPFWRANDAEDRQGITEIRYVEGFLGYWDELRKRHPNMLIDTCASGGRRNDIETLRRAVPLLRSDYILEPVGQQNHTMGIAPWIPFYGTGVKTPNAYEWRSQMCPSITCCYDMRDRKLDYDALRKLHAQWMDVSPLMLKDFYMLTPYSADNAAWVAWQFDDPEKGEGFVLAFRRGESFYEAAKLKLNGIDSAATYDIADLDMNAAKKESGTDLAKGLSLAESKQPDSRLIIYKRIDEKN